MERSCGSPRNIGAFRLPGNGAATRTQPRGIQARPQVRQYLCRSPNVWVAAPSKSLASLVSSLAVCAAMLVASLDSSGSCTGALSASLFSVMHCMCPFAAFSGVVAAAVCAAREDSYCIAISTRIAAACGAPTLAVDYRLAPEFAASSKAAIDDAMNGLRRAALRRVGSRAPGPYDERFRCALRWSMAACLRW